MTGADQELASLVSELEGLSERVGDLAMDRLREAAEATADEVAAAVAVERRINRARRSIEKAVSLLRADEEEG